MQGAKYKELFAYQKSFELVKKVYTLTKDFPKEELYGAISQLRRAVISIPVNIAEGYMRGSKEYVHFLKISLGSSAEVDTLLSLSKELSFCTGKDVEPLIYINTEVSKLLITYINRLTTKN